MTTITLVFARYNAPTSRSNAASALINNRATPALKTSNADISNAVFWLVFPPLLLRSVMFPSEFVTISAAPG